MAVLKCKMCGGSLEIIDGVSVIECLYCGTKHKVSELNEQQDETTYTLLLKRAFTFIEDEKWDSAKEYAERVLDNAPENENAYLVKLLADKEVKRKEDLQRCKYTFEENENYQKILKYGSQSLINELKVYISYIEKENELQDIKKYIQWAKEAQSIQEIHRQIKSAREKINKLHDIEQCKEFVSECDKIAELTESYELELRRNIDEITSAIKTSYNKKRDEIRYRIETYKKTANHLQQQYDELGILATLKKIKIKQQIEEENKKTEQLEHEICALEKEEKEKISDCLIEKEEELGAIYGKRYLELGMPKIVRTIDLNTKIADIREKKAGQIVTWGTEEDKLVKREKKRDIEWIILEKDNDRVLLLSRTYFARMKLHSQENEGYNSYENSFCDWEECSLRNWLNDEFKNDKFNKKEQKRILKTSIVIGKHPVKTIKDSIFLLSEEEQEKYRAYSCNYLYSDKLDWWLRPIKDEQCKDNVRVVDAKSNYGKVKHSYFDIEYAVRPAMWISLK